MYGNKICRMTCSYWKHFLILGFPGGSDGKVCACNAENLGSIPGSGRSPGEGNDNPLQCSCLENPRDGGAWWAAVCGVTQSQTWLKQLSSSRSSNNYWKSAPLSLLPCYPSFLLPPSLPPSLFLLPLLPLSLLGIPFVLCFSNCCVTSDSLFLLLNTLWDCL